MRVKQPILIDLPYPINTERLLIRPMMGGDGQEIFNLIKRSKKELSKYLFWVSAFKTIEDFEIRARRLYTKFILRQRLTFLIFFNNDLVGGININRIDWYACSASIGYFLDTKKVGNGFAQEALSALTIYAFKQVGLKRVEVLCDDENHKSAKVAESLGFTLESKGMGQVPVPGAKDIRLSRTYVRFNTQGLEESKVKW